MALTLPGRVADAVVQRCLDFLAARFPINTQDIADDAVTAAKIPADAITSSELGPNSVLPDDQAAAAAPSATINAGDAASEGSATSFLRSDAQYAVSTGTASTLSGTNAEGTATSLARSDHNHALPDYGTRFVYATSGSTFDLVPGANILYFGLVSVLRSCTLTGIGYWVGTVSNGNVKAGLFDSGGTKVAETTGTVAQATANTFQSVAFASTYAATPGVYFAALIFSSATARCYRGGIPMGPSSTASPGSHTIPSSVTPPTVPSSAFTTPFMTTY